MTTENESETRAAETQVYVFEDHSNTVLVRAESELAAKGKAFDMETSGVVLEFTGTVKELVAEHGENDSLNITQV